MYSIILIIPYFGKWPQWFDAYLVSVATNPTIHWLCPTDCEIPVSYPGNITFFPTTLGDLNKHVNKIVEAKVPLNPRKFCDLKPAYAEIFSAEVMEYDFWGICDMDIVWGDIRKFISEEMLNTYDIISSRKENISGHFTLFRNTQIVNSLYKKLPDYKTLFEHPKFKWTDEIVLSNFIKRDPSFNSLDLDVFWPIILCNQEKGRDSHQEYYLDKWLWKNGRMLELQNGAIVNEVMYLHFINWKRTMKYCEVEFTDDPSQFYISYDGMHYNEHSTLAKIWNDFTNLFDGFAVRERNRVRKYKIKSWENRIVNKLKNL